MRKLLTSLRSGFNKLRENLFKRLLHARFRYDVFISYTHRDRDYAVNLKEQLKRLDFTCFIDEEESPPGLALDPTLEKALSKSAVLVLLATERALTRPYIVLEFEKFAQTKRNIIPVNIAEALTGNNEEALKKAPWNIIKSRKLVWIDEDEDAFLKKNPSPRVADGIDKLFKYTRRRTRVRTEIIGTAVIVLLAALGAGFIIRGQAANLAEQARLTKQAVEETAKQQGIAEQAKIDATIQLGIAQIARVDAEQQRESARLAREDALKQQDAAKKAAAEAEKQQKLATTAQLEADKQQRNADAFNLIEQSQRTFESAPLPGLRLALDAWSRVPKDNSKNVKTIVETVQERMSHGRILSENRVEKPYFMDGSPLYILARQNKPSELRNVETHELVETLPGKVADVKTASERGVTVFSPAVAPYFLINYENGNRELRRLDTGKKVKLSGDIDEFGEDYKKDAPYFLVNFEESQDVLVNVNQPEQIVPLSGKEDSWRITFAPGSPYFLVGYKDVPDELRRTDTGEIVSKLTHRVGILPKDSFDKSTPLNFSKDKSYFAISYKDDAPETSSDYYITSAELRRTDTGEVIPLSGDVEKIIFSSYTDNFVVAYKDLPGELRLTNSDKIIKLRAKVEEAYFSPVSKQLVIDYVDAPGEIRNLDESEGVALPENIYEASISSDRTYFILSYEDFSNELRQMNTGKVIQLPRGESLKVDFGPAISSLFIVSYSEAPSNVTRQTPFRLTRPQKKIRSATDRITPALSDPSRTMAMPAEHKEVRRKDTGEKVVFRPDKEANAEFESDTYLKVCYDDVECELFRLDNGKSIMTSKFFYSLTLSPDGAFFVTKGSLGLNDNQESLDELRRADTGELIQKLPNNYSVLTFSPDGSCFVGSYYEKGAEVANSELRRTKDGKLLAKLEDIVRRDGVIFSKNSDYFLIRYGDEHDEDATSEIRLSRNGEVVTIVRDAILSSDGSYFIAEYGNNKSELWKAGTESPYKIADLGLGFGGERFNISRGLLSVWYKDGRFDVLDLNWLVEMKGDPTNLSPSELKNIACRPFNRKGFTREQSKGQLPQICSGMSG